MKLITRTEDAAIVGDFGRLAPVATMAGELWVARDGDRTVGRIGASPGAVGFYEAETPAVGDALLAAAEAWLVARGCDRAIGPMALNTWFPYRFRIDDHAEQFAWEPNNPAEYPATWERRGWKVSATYASTATSNLGALVEALRPAREAVLAAGFRIAFIDRARLLDEDMRDLYRISMAAYADALAFQPIPFEAFRALYVPLADKADLTGSLFVETAAGERVGYFVTFVDGPYFVWKTLAVHPAHRGARLSTILFQASAEVAVARGIDRAVFALVREGVTSDAYARYMHPLWTHRYALYEKALTSA